MTRKTFDRVGSILFFLCFGDLLLWVLQHLVIQLTFIPMALWAILGMEPVFLVLPDKVLLVISLAWIPLGILTAVWYDFAIRFAKD
jgi:hypothetical protein